MRPPPVNEKANIGVVTMEGFSALALGQVLGTVGDLAGSRLVRVAFSGSSELMLIGTSAVSIVLLTAGCIVFGSTFWWVDLVTRHPERIVENGVLAVVYHLAEAKLFGSPDGATLKVSTTQHIFKIRALFFFPLESLPSL